MKTAGGVRIGLAVALCLGAVSASAQTDAPSAPPLLARSRHQTLDLTLSASGAYDDNLVAQINQTLNPESQVGGGYQGLSTRIQYRRKFRYASFDLGESSLARYYPSLSDSMVVQHSGTAAFSYQKRATTIGLSQSSMTSPFYSYTTLPALTDPQLGEVTVKTSDQSASLRRSITNSSTGAISQGLGRRLVADVSGTYQDSTFQNEDTTLRTVGGAGRLAYRIVDGLGLVAGYTYQEGMYRVKSVPSNVTVRSYNFGLDFNKTMSASRRTAFSFHTGTAVVEDSDKHGVYEFVGDARVVRQMSRSWKASASYRRGVGLVSGVDTPTLSNAVAVGLNGTMGRRLNAALVGGFSRDQIGVTVAQNMGNTYSGSASLSYAVSRLVSMTAAYVIYQYEFDRDILLPEGLPPDFKRQELRFGFDVSLPLVR